MYGKYHHDDNDDEDGFPTFGTPFAPLEANEIVSRKPELDQTVRDERGRRRFHGAFTGGFSAGYWNTVGSAEGFTPKIFSSSRKNKYDQQSASAARPEDFMDDEDFGSFGIAPKRIHIKDDFAESTTFAGLRDVNLSFDDVIKSVFAPAKEMIGMKLFRKMKRQARLDEKERQGENFLKLTSSTYESSLSDNSQSQAQMKFETKDNFHGLGYNGMLDANQYLFSSDTNKMERTKNAQVSATLSGGRRLKISGEAFGYGAFEDDDDMAVYSHEDMSQYDFAIGSAPKPPSSSDRKRKLTQSNQTGEIELEGFHKVNKVINMFRDMQLKFKPPVLPKNWRPKIVKRREGKKSRWSNSAPNNSTQGSAETNNIISGSNTKQPNQQKQQLVLNSNLRAVILGEEVFHKSGVAKSKQTDDNKDVDVTSIGTNKSSFTNTVQTPPAPVPPPPQRPLSSFFASRFIRSESTINDVGLNAGLSTYKEASTLPGLETGSNRKKEETTMTDKAPVRTSYEWHPHKLLCKRFGLQNPYPLFPDIIGIVSVGRGNVGEKARNATSCLQSLSSSSTKSFSNSSTKSALFSGLFQNLSDLNNFNPKVNAETNSTVEKVTTKSSQSVAIVTKVITSDYHSNDDETSKPVNKVREEDDEEEEGKNQEEEEEEKERPRPHMDLFRSIFASDEEEEEDDNDQNNDVDLLNEKTNDQSNETLNDNNNKTVSSKSRSEPSGLFEGINLDELHHNFNPLAGPTLSTSDGVEDKQKSSNQTNELISVDDDQDDSDECYGPALPSASTILTDSVNKSTTNSNSATNNTTTNRSRSPLINKHHKSSSSHHRHHHHKSKTKKKSKDKKQHKEKKAKKHSHRSSSDRSTSKNGPTRGRKKTNTANLSESNSTTSDSDDSTDDEKNIEDKLLSLLKNTRYQR